MKKFELKIWIETDDEWSTELISLAVEKRFNDRHLRLNDYRVYYVTNPDAYKNSNDSGWEE